MESNKYVIRKQFLDVNKYKSLVDQAMIYQNLFKAWLGQISQFYKGSFNYDGFQYNKIAYRREGLSKYVYSFINTLYSISNQHLNYIGSIMRQSASLSLYKQMQKIVSKISTFNEFQQSFQRTYRQLLTYQNRVVVYPTNNQQFYLYTNWIKRLNSLQKYLKSLRSITKNKPDKQKLYQMSGEVELQIIEFRKKIINYKYGYLKQGVKISRQLLKCLSQYLAIGKQYLLNINQKIQDQIHKSDRSLKMSRQMTSSHTSQENIHEIQQNYLRQSQQFKDTLSTIQNLFQFQKESPINVNSLEEKFKQSYTGNEVLLTQMFDTYDIFQKVYKYRKQMYQNINNLLLKIQSEHKQKKKAAEVISSLTKRKSMQHQIQHPSTETKLKISRQFDLDNIRKSLCQTIDQALKSFNQLSKQCYQVSLKATQQKRTLNNMSISYTYKQILIYDRRPNKLQMQLWKDWRDFRDYQDVKPRYQQNFILKLIQDTEKVIESQQTEEKIGCDKEEKFNGRFYMQILPQKINLQSKKQPSVNFVLPIKQIDSVEQVKKKLIFKMSNGSEIKLSSFKNVGEIQIKINQIILNKQEKATHKIGAGNSLPKKPLITITPEQLQAIKKKAPEIQKQRIKLDKWTKHYQFTLKNVSIQEVYETIFSDQKGCPLNKDMSFFEYMTLKSKNTDYKPAKYDPVGPYFYTRKDKDVTFINCPIASYRQIQFEHPLPKIPFLPKSCHCKTKQKIYWISEKHFQHNAEVYSSGTDMMQSFYTCNQYVVKQVEQNVHIQIWGKVEFVKPTAFKSVLMNGVQGQVKVLMPQYIKNMQKCMNHVKKARNTAQSPSDQAGNGTDNKQQGRIDQNSFSSNKQKQKQKMSMKMQVIIFVVVTIIINILINLVLSFRQAS